MVVTLQENFYAFRVMFNDLLHLYLKKSDIVAVTSWFDDQKTYSIEVTMKDGAKILTEYDNAQAWQQVLGLLNTSLK